MSPWELLAVADKNEELPFKLEVGDYSIARKAPSKGKGGEPADNPNHGYETTKGGSPWLTVPQFDRNMYMLDNKGNIINKMTGAPIGNRSPRNMSDINIVR